MRNETTSTSALSGNNASWGNRQGAFLSLLLSQFLLLITGQSVNLGVRRVRQILSLVCHSSVRSVLWLHTLSRFSDTLPFRIDEKGKKKGVISSYKVTVVGIMGIIPEYIVCHALRLLGLPVWKFLWEVPQYANHMAAFSAVQHAHTLNGSLMSGRHAKLALPALKTDFFPLIPV